MESLGDVGAKTVLQNDSYLDNSMKKRCLQMLQKDLSYKALPIGLTPVPFSEMKLSELKNMQLSLIDDLIKHLVKEGTTLIELLTPVAQTDEFIDRLLEIYKKTMSNEITEEKPYLSVIRSDFFLDAVSLNWKLIEINTVAVAGGFFSDGIDHLYMERGLDADVSLVDRGIRTDTIVDGIVHAHKMLLYSIATNANRGVDSNSNIVGDSSESACDDSTQAPIYYNDMRQSESIGDSSQTAMSHKCPYAVLVLVGQAYRETFQQDQLAICKKLSKRDIPVILSSFEDLAKSTYDVTTDGRLIFTTRDKLFTKQLTCVYFRSGYDPKHYVDEKCWKFVEDAELSRVVLLPSVGLHLAGTKRVQCALIENDALILKAAVPDNPLTETFRSTFVSQFELNPGNVDEVLRSPGKYVVKPQREGGTNNLFGQDIVTHITPLQNKNLLSRYIAMELIKGQIVRNYPVRTKDAETVYLDEAVAEVGACSVLVESTTEPKIVSHELAGLLTKIKRATSNEAGVSVGHGFLTSLSAI